MSSAESEIPTSSAPPPPARRWEAPGVRRKDPKQAVLLEPSEEWPQPFPRWIITAWVGPSAPWRIGREGSSSREEYGCWPGKEAETTSENGEWVCNTVCGVWLFVCFLLMVRSVHSHRVCLHQAPSTVPILASCCCPLNWCSFPSIFVDAETKVQRGKSLGQGQRVFGVRTGIWTQICLVPKLITLHRINTGSSLESPACPSRPVVSVNLENVGDRWQYCWTKECLSSPALLTYGYFWPSARSLAPGAQRGPSVLNMKA